MRFLSFGVLVALLLAIPLHASCANHRQAAFIIMEGEGLDTTAIDQVIKRAAEAGGHIQHVIISRSGARKKLIAASLIGSIAPQAEDTIKKSRFVKSLCRTHVDSGTRKGLGTAAVLAAEAWNQLLNEEGIYAGGPGPLLNDVREPPTFARPLHNTVTVPPDEPSSTAPGIYQTSEFLIGRVAVGIVLPESAGEDENWDNGAVGRQTTVFNAIVSGANWWATKGGVPANLTFFYDTQYSVPTQYEPIDLPIAQEDLWISEVLASMGYTGATYFDQAFNYTNAIRSSYTTNWAFAVFVADSYNDADGSFPDGYTAYAYRHGPFMVMSYDNGGWGIGRMNRVFAHELAHIFGAADEYSGVSTCNSSTCDNIYGYLGGSNGNCAACTLNQTPCVMASNDLTVPPCEFTQTQLGWRDTDGDSIFDPVDNTPVVSGNLNYVTPPYTDQSQIQGQGYVQEQPCPTTTRAPVSINTVTASYSIDGGPWSNAVPSDGEFDGGYEPYSLTSESQPDGPHTVTIRATNSAGNTADTSPMAITIDTAPPPPPTSVKDEGAATANTSSLTFEWAHADDFSGINAYLLSIQDDLGSTLLLDLNVGNSLSYTATDLPLTLGRKYSAMVKCINGLQMIGPDSQPSNGVYSATFYNSIGEIKKRASAGDAVAINDVYVTASAVDGAPSGINVEDGNRAAGIRTDSTESYGRDTRVQVAGRVYASSGEAVLLGDAEVEQVTPGSKAIPPLFMNERAFGGGSLGIEPAVSGGFGINTIGLLVRICGKVTYASDSPPYSYSLDDGSCLVTQFGHGGIDVQCGSTLPPEVGAYQDATGICGIRNGFPVLYQRQDSN